jgi:site-specific recombinase XerD
VLATLSSFFGWLRRNRRIERNPCGNVHRPDAAPARDRTLTDNEIVAFWHACDDLGEPIGPRLKLLLLTGCRRTELAGTFAFTCQRKLSRLHQLDAIFTIFGASDRDKRLILQGRGLRNRL